MARIHADIDAVKAMKDSVDRFQYEQRQVLVGAKREIETTCDSLERKAERWERELVERQRALDECHCRAAAAAEHGGEVDCTSLVRAVAEAEDRLENVRRWQAFVEQEVAAYEDDRRRFRECVEVDIRRAQQYLRDMINTLTAARATQIRQSP